MNEKMANRKQEIVESLIIFGVMTGILLPVRMFFYTFVSTTWFYSFGVISAISIIMIILVRKNKLGRFGEIFDRQMRNVQHGKRGIVVYGQLGFMLLFAGCTISAIEIGNSVYSEIKEEVLEKTKGLDDPKTLMQKAKEMEFYDWAAGFTAFTFGIFFAFPQVSVSLAIVNDVFHGFLLHFATVALVEIFEVLGILLFYRICAPKIGNR